MTMYLFDTNIPSIEIKMCASNMIQMLMFFALAYWDLTSVVD